MTGADAITRVTRRSVSQTRDETRWQLAQEISSAFDYLAKSGLFGASVGDTSVRVPDADSILVTPLMPFIGKLTEKDILEVSMDGKLVHKRGRPTLAMQMHLAIYRCRPDVEAIVHSHAPMATVLGICGLPIPPVTFDSVPFVNLPRVPVSHDSRWAEEVSAHIAGDAPAALLLNHGIVTVGKSLHQAVRRALALEDTARVLVLSYLLQQVPDALPPEAVEVLKQTSF